VTLLRTSFFHPPAGMDTGKNDSQNLFVRRSSPPSIRAAISNGGFYVSILQKHECNGDRTTVGEYKGTITAQPQRHLRLERDDGSLVRLCRFSEANYGQSHSILLPQWAVGN